MMGYTEVIQVMGAMIIFALVLTTANRFMLNNDTVRVSSEVEVRAVSIAQDLIEFSKTVPFDQATAGNTVPDDVPDDFVNGNPISTTTATNRQTIDSFEELNEYSETLNTDLGEFEVTSIIEYMDPADLTSNAPTSATIYKRISVTVSNESMMNDVNLSYIRVYNNTN
ncbi:MULTISPECIES: hypothetical protein [Rhodohalobacter]|uniref:Uncharacterized protein n=1 Tax=Rhodohalobacter barkolensis TaxID=2053187 RepID=A0A2N0VH52_9BACT|nr:hypothetical protein [Rhodohalobacter barkolensis]PKD43503.1 hypothetical protein CWD77_08000 [Rhodohalobacter barkolensis]